MQRALTLQCDAGEHYVSCLGLFDRDMYTKT